MARQVAQDFKASLKTDGTSSQYVDTGFTPVVTSAFSLSCWIKPSGYKTGLNNESGIFAVTDFNGHGILAAMNRGGNSQIISIGGDADPDKNGTYKLQLGVWYHFVFVYAGTTVQTYINGVLDINTSYTIRTQPTNHLFLSSLSNAFSAYRSFLGNAVDYRLFTGYAMTQADVTVLYTNGKNPVVPSGLWLFQEGAGTTVIDTSGNGRNGTITGATYTSDVPSKKRSRVGDNLVYNGDFEYAPPFTAATAANWIDGTSAGSSTNTLFGWYIQSTGGSSKSAQYDTSVKHSGIASLKVSMGTIADSGYVDSNNPNARKAVTAIPCSPNTSYTISGYIKTNNSSGAYLRINECTGAVAFSTGTNSTKITGTQDWTLVTLTITTGANTRYLEAICQIDAGTVQDNWFDDIVLTQTVPVGRSTAQDFKSSLSITTGRVDLGSLGNPQSSATSAFTLAAWIKTNQKNATIYGGRDSTLGNPITTFTVGYNDVNNSGTGKLGITVRDDNSVGLTAIGGNTVVSDGQWHHVAVTRNTSKLITLYVDGRADGTVTDSMAAGVTINSRRLGNAAQGTTAQFQGLIDDFMQTNTALSAAEIVTLMTIGSVPVTPIVRLKLNEGAGTTALDTSGNGNNGTITGATFSADVPAQKRLLVGGNLVKNGDFEYSPPFTAATTGNTVYVDGTAAGSGSNALFGWATLNAASVGNFAVRFDPSNAYSGTNGLKLSTTATTSVIHVAPMTVLSAANLKTYAIPAIPNTSYTFTFRMKTNYVSGDAATGAFAQITERDANNGNGVNNISTAIKTTTGWTLYTVTFTTAATTRYLVPRLAVDGNNGATTLVMDAWFDDITLTANTARAIA